MNSISLLRIIMLLLATNIVLTVVVRVSASNNCTKSIERGFTGVCPTWQYKPSRGAECVCGLEIEKAIKCRSSNSSLRIAYCITYNETSNRTFIGGCPYNTLTGYHLYNSLPTNVDELNERMCGPLKRTGLLCSQCEEGLGPAVFSPYRECLKCMDEPYGWILYFFMATFPLTILCLVVIIFQINVASPYLNGFVLAAQIITNTIKHSPYNFVNEYIEKLVATCYGFWNLDFFNYVLPPFCIKEGMSTLTVIALEYTVALYPVLFTVIVYSCIALHDNGCRILVCCWRPCHYCLARFRRNWKLKGSVISAFATFLLLSYSKLCSISFSLLQYTHVHDKCGRNKFKVFYDASYLIFSKEHLPYVVVAFTIITIFVSLPALFILFYQNRVFQKLLNCIKFKCVLIHELANICQGSFKNGTSPGTRDYRWFAGLYLLLRIIFVASFNFHHNQLWLILVSSVTALLLTILRPYRNDFYNKFDSVLWTTFSLGNSWQLAYEKAPEWQSNISYALPLVYIFCLLAWSVITSCIKKCRSHFAKREQHVTDQDETNTQAEQLPDRLLQPSEYTQLISPSNHSAMISDTQNSVQSNDTY